MANWFGKKPQPEKSPAGTIIHRYDSLSTTPIGLTGDATAGFRQAREEVYKRLFGEAETISHEILPLIPHIDVRTHYLRGNDGSKECTLVTSGMSDVEMNLPAGAKAPRRVELIFYCTEPKQEYINTMRWLAHFPHNEKTFIGFGHTIPNGNPPAPFFGSQMLDTILLLPPILKKDQTLPDELILGGEPVDFLWLVPITTAECNLKLAKGLGVLLDLFGKNRHPYVFEPNRKSYV